MAYVLAFVAAAKEEIVLQAGGKHPVEIIQEQIELEKKRKELQREKVRKYYINNREKKRQHGHEYFKNLSAERKEERRTKLREYYQNLSPDKKEERKRYMREYQRKQTRQKQEARLQKMCENRHKIETRKSTRASNRSEYDEHVTAEEVAQNSESSISLDMNGRVFCYTCRMQFLNNCALLEHIITHVTLPSVIVSKIDGHKRVVYSIKKDSEDMQNSDLNNEISKNIFFIKTERMEYDEDIQIPVDHT